MKKIKLITFVSILFANSGAIVVLADEYGIDQTAGDAGLPQMSSLPDAFGSVLGVALSMISVVFFVLMLYAGIRWMIARGKEEQEEKAKETIIGAVIGMVIIMLSYALTTFVFKGTTGGTISSNSSNSDTSWDGSFCVMKNKPTVCTRINGDSKNCVSNISVFPNEAECSSALKGSPTGVVMSCKPAYTQSELKNKLQQEVCDAAIYSNPTENQTKCDNEKVQGAFICEYSAPSNTCTVITDVNTKVDLNVLCKQGAKDDCEIIKFQLGEDIGSICNWQ